MYILIILISTLRIILRKGLDSLIIKFVEGDILKSNHEHIAFAVNAEGYNDAGFAGLISRKFWPELACIGPCELGKVLEKKVENYCFYACVIHDFDYIGWSKASVLLEECLKKINISDDTELAMVAIGAGIVGVLGGANTEEIMLAMKHSAKKIAVYALPK